jgi:hypothetical protein
LRRWSFNAPEVKVMKTWIFRAVALAMTLSTAQALACPVGNADPPKRPVVQNVSFQASELFERAQQLETAAAGRERSAQAAERDAETFAGRARILRNQAALVNVADRASIFAAADELSSRAASSRAIAAEDRAQATDLRVQARATRERAVQLVRAGNGGGGGWRARPTATQARAETSI